jgi:hypothetical protein
MGLGNWNHVYATDDKCYTVAILTLFIHAFNDRRLTGRGTYTLPIDDTFHCWSYGFWRSLQLDELSIVSAYILDMDYDGDDPASNPIVIDWDYIKSHALGGNGYTRKYPKEFASASSTVYNDGNAFVNGDYARNMTDRLIYHRVSGAWAADATHLPDIVMAYGKMEANDYMGVWILNEIRDVLNLLDTIGTTSASWIAGGTFNIASSPSNGDDGSGSYMALATAKAAAEAEFLANEGNNGDNQPPFWNSQTQYQGDDGPHEAHPEFLTNIAAAQGKMTVADDSNGYTPAIDFYGVGAPFALGDITSFEGNGVALDGLMKKWDTQIGAGTGGTVTSAYLGSLAVGTWAPDPDVPSDPRLAGSSYGVGYIVEGAIIVFRYDVAGGFTETKSSPS